MVPDLRGLLRRLARDGVWGLRLTLAQCLLCSERLLTGDLLKVLAGCRKVEDWRLACEFLRRLRAPELVVFNAFMATCCGLGAWDQSMRALCKMRAAAVQSDVVTYNTILGALRSARWQGASAILRRALEQQVRCDSGSYNMLLGACQRWQTALDVTGKLGFLALRPDEVTLTALLTSYAAVASWRLAMSDAQAYGLDLFALNALCNCAARAQAWEKCLEAVRSGARHGLEADVVTRNTMLVALEGAWHRALHAACAETANAITLNTACSACATGSAWEVTLSLPKRQDAYSLSASSTAWAALGRWEEVLWALGLGRKQHMESPQLVSAAVAGCGARWQQMLQLILPGASSEAFNAAFQGCYDSLQWPISVGLLSTMRCWRLPLDSTGSSCVLRLHGRVKAWRTGLTEPKAWSSHCWACEAATQPAPPRLTVPQFRDFLSCGYGTPPALLALMQRPGGSESRLRRPRYALSVPARRCLRPQTCLREDLEQWVKVGSSERAASLAVRVPGGVVQGV